MPNFRGGADNAQPDVMQMIKRSPNRGNDVIDAGAGAPPPQMGSGGGNMAGPPMGGNPLANQASGNASLADRKAARDMNRASRPPMREMSPIRGVGLPPPSAPPAGGGTPPPQAGSGGGNVRPPSGQPPYPPRPPMGGGQVGGNPGGTGGI
jgi:hypothetical protein